MNDIPYWHKEKRILVLRRKEVEAEARECIKNIRNNVSGEENPKH